jgi:predicted metalloprotease with PDZ domain
VKEASKFLATGLQVGSRIVAINGKPVPDCTSQVLKIMNNAERELEIVAEKPVPRIQQFLVAVCEDKKCRHRRYGAGKSSCRRVL